MRGTVPTDDTEIGKDTGSGIIILLSHTLHNITFTHPALAQCPRRQPAPKPSFLPHTPSPPHHGLQTAPTAPARQRLQHPR